MKVKVDNSLVNLQEEPLLSLNLFHINCNSREESLARIALLHKCRSWNINFLDVRSHGLGLARAVRRGMIVCLSTERVALVLVLVLVLVLLVREIIWTEEQEEEADTRVGWEIIEDLQGQAQPWCQRLIEDFDLPDKTLSNMELKGSSEVDEEEEDSHEEL